MTESTLLALGGGLLESLGQAAAIAGMGLLVLMLVALGTYGYKQLRGGGIEWPDEDEETEGVSRGGDDDEWDYY